MRGSASQSCHVERDASLTANRPYGSRIADTKKPIPIIIKTLLNASHAHAEPEDQPIKANKAATTLAKFKASCLRLYREHRRQATHGA